MAQKPNLLTFWEKNGRLFLSQAKKFWDFPDLLSSQRKWFEEFVSFYMKKLFEEQNPIYDIAWEKFYLTINDLKVSAPVETVSVCKRKESTYWGIISGRVKLFDNYTWELIFNKSVNIGTLPLITEWGSYIINWVERVIIPQLVRSYWLFYSFNPKDYSYSFKLIPKRWAWIQVYIEKSGNTVVRINKSRKFPITALLKVFGFETEESILEISKDIVEEDDFDYLKYTLEKDSTTNASDAAVFIYNKIRPGEVIDEDSAMDYIKSMFLNVDRMDLWRIARRKINAKLNLDKPIEWEWTNVFDSEDLVNAVKYLFNLANRKRNYYTDDIDHLSNRRVRTMWEVLYSHLQPIIKRFVKSIKWKLSVLNPEEQIKLTDLVNLKIIDNSIKSFFATSQLSQFLEQVNPLAEVEHKRRLTALGPGGLKRETTTFEVRDVHQSHYWRIWPIETPEWHNIWLVVHQALYSKLNEDWFVETPAIRIKKEVKPVKKELLGRISEETLKDKKWNIIINEDEYINEDIAKKIKEEYWNKWDVIRVRPFLTEEMEYISPEYDEKYIIADITIDLDDNKNILSKRVPARHFLDMEIFHVNDITHVDVNPSQIYSSNTSIIPFVDYDDATRAAMGTNMQRQAVPLVKPEAPLVWTWLEWDIASMTYAVVKAEDDGEVVYVDGKRVKVKYKHEWTKEYELMLFKRSNQKTVIHQKTKVSLWDKFKKWDILAEWPSVVDWEIGLWKNLKVAFMSWEWYNYEDAIIISRRLVKDDELTSIHIDEYEIEVADTKLWPEDTTNDIPWVAVSKLKNLDESGIIRIWANVKWWDILIWKITPKSEWDLAPEEKLIQAIFGDKSKSYKDTSLYMPSGSWGKVIDVVSLDIKKWDNLPAWVRRKIKVYVATTRKIEVWDKLAWRHWNKWIIAKVVPEEDMPFTKDWVSTDIILNPLGVVSRMNIWQVMEVQLWLIAKFLETKFAVPLFSNFSLDTLKGFFTKFNLPEEWRFELFDWRTWEAFHNKVTVWYMNIMKLSHMVEDKIHARSVWPYSLITQQPLWGKAREWWQRFWEMEVWALEAYSSVYALQEMLTIKSDDILWRNRTYDAIIKGWDIKVSWLPESFNFLMFVMKWIAQDIVPLSKEDIEKFHRERKEKIVNLWLKGITSQEKTGLDDSAQIEDLKKKEKEEVMDNVINEMKDFWEVEEY